MFSIQTRNVAKAIAEKDFAKAMSLRDPEFAETLDGFYHTSQLAKEPDLPIHKVRYTQATIKSSN